MAEHCLKPLIRGIAAGLLLGTALGVESAAAEAAPDAAVSARLQGRVCSTTIDFLDYAFYMTDPAVEYFTEAQYEEVIRTVAVTGIGKIYIRVDVCGLTLYPTKVGKQYAGGHKEKGAAFLVNTLKRYDPLAKGLELGRKYGLEVWAWDTLLDDDATGDANYDSARGLSEEEEALRREFGERPLKDPFLIEHPQYQQALDPRLIRTAEQRRAGHVQAAPITKILITSQPTGRASRVQPEQFGIWVSDDNISYRRYEREFSFEVQATRPARLLLDGLHIVEDYVKLAFNEPWSDNRFSIAGTPDTYGRVFAGGEWRRIRSPSRVLKRQCAIHRSRAQGLEEPVDQEPVQ